MPADRRTGRVFGHEDLFEILQREAGRLANATAEVVQEIGDWICWQSFVLIEIVAPAERDSSPLSLKAVKLKFSEWKRCDLCDEPALFVWRDHIFLIEETIGQSFVWCLRKQRVLHAGHGAY
jgi:hypothetical protein